MTEPAPGRPLAGEPPPSVSSDHGSPSVDEQPVSQEGAGRKMAPAQAFLIGVTAVVVGFAALIAILMYWLVPALNS